MDNAKLCPLNGFATCNERCALRMDAWVYDKPRCALWSVADGIIDISGRLDNIDDTLSDICDALNKPNKEVRP